MWTDPWGAFQRAEIENDVARTLDRVVAYRLGSGNGERRPAVATRRLALTAESVARDAGDIERELRWRLSALGVGERVASPFLPDGDPVAPLVLLEAEKLWSDLGGFRIADPAGDEAASLRARVEAAIEELHAGAGTFGASVLIGRPAQPRAAPDNFQLQRGLYALEQGHVLGVGLGRGQPEAVPGLTEDLAIASIGESLGIAGILLVALLVLLLTTRGIALGRHQHDRFVALLAIGLSALLGLQALISLGGLTGMVPFTGLTYPFVSRSGTGIVSAFLLVALLMVVSARPQQPPLSPPSTRGRFSRVLGSGGFPIAFAIVLGNIALLQFTGRTLAPGPLLAGLPGPGAAFLHASDQWNATSYRRIRGSIVDRRGGVLAGVPSFGSRRVFPDPLTATSLAHTLLQLDLSFGERLLEAQPASPSIGPTLVSTIDSGVQRAVDAAFDDGTREAGLQDVRALRGAVAVLDVRNGRIVALLSRPRFGLDELSDPVAWARAEAKERRSGFAYRYLHRAVHGFYPPGSIFKTVTAAGILERGFHTLHSRDFDYEHGPLGRRAPDRIDQLGPWHQLPLQDGPPITDGNHPQLDRWLFDLQDAFIWSCNVAFAQMGLELGPADLVNVASRFGFERQLRVPGLGTTTSTLDGDSAKPIDQRYLARSASNLARTGFGQGRARVTPLQMALVPAAIANRGTIMQPHIVAGWKASDGRWLERYQPRVFVDTRLSRQTIADLRRMMSASVTRGWARTARVNPNNTGPGVAGKTGSAEWSEVLDASHAWFIGFFPAEKPRLALAVLVERGGAGPTVAGRIARRIFAADAVQRYVEEVESR
jgi:peptidoglycan glycosyltransferase